MAETLIYLINPLGGYEVCVFSKTAINYYQIDNIDIYLKLVNHILIIEFEREFKRD